MKKIFYFTLLNVVFSMGIQTRYVPQSALLLANSSTGIAGHYSINPANIYNTNNFFSFSRNDWLVDTKGQKVSYMFSTKKNKKSYFSIETLVNDKIPIYGTASSNEPIGYFDTYWYSIEYSQAYSLDELFKIKSKISVGYKAKLNLSKLYAKNITSYSFDVGIHKLVNDYFSFGFILNNISSNFPSSLNTSSSYNDPYVGLGLNYKMPKVYLDLSLDLVYKNDDYFKKVSFSTLFSYVNIILGLTESDRYSDFSYGISFTFRDWSIIYASLSHEDSSLGAPSSIEISKHF